MQQRNCGSKQSGGAFGWLLVWLAGIALLVYLAIMLQWPKTASSLQSSVTEAAASLSPAADVVVDGRDVLVGGALDSDQQTIARDTLMAVPGVRRVQFSQDAPSDTPPASESDATENEGVLPVTDNQATDTSNSDDSNGESAGMMAGTEDVAASPENATASEDDTDESPADAPDRSEAESVAEPKTKTETEVNAEAETNNSSGSSTSDSTISNSTEAETDSASDTDTAGDITEDSQASEPQAADAQPEPESQTDPSSESGAADDPEDSSAAAPTDNGANDADTPEATQSTTTTDGTDIPADTNNTGRASAGLRAELDDLDTSAISFEFSSATLTDDSKPVLDRLKAALENHPEGSITVTGHTDSVGSTEANQAISQGRADAVRNYLIELGIEPDRIEAIGYGESRPIATNETSEGRKQNRRIELDY